MLLFGEEVFLGLRVDAFDFRRLCADVTHPRPLSRGEVRVLVSCWEWWVECVGFPSREGIKGCVTMRGAVWDEVFLLLFEEEVFLVFSGARKYLSSFDDRFGCRWLCTDVTHPRPLSRGEIVMLVSCW